MRRERLVSARVLADAGDAAVGGGDPMSDAPEMPKIGLPTTISDLEIALEAAERGYGEMHMRPIRQALDWLRYYLAAVSDE